MLALVGYAATASLNNGVKVSPGTHPPTHVYATHRKS
jgi:hypothetical protein